jgi:hypothetical protein
MRRILILGAATALVAFGVSAAYADNPNVPFWSPYAIMGHDNTPTTASTPAMTEGRAADTSAPNRWENKARMRRHKLEQQPKVSQ